MKITLVCRNESYSYRTFGKEAAKKVGNNERDRKGIRINASSKKARLGHLAD